MAAAPQTPPKGGRPKGTGEPRTTLAAWVPVSRHAAVQRAAKDARVSMSEYVNRAMARAVRGK